MTAVTRGRLNSDKTLAEMLIEVMCPHKTAEECEKSGRCDCQIDAFNIRQICQEEHDKIRVAEQCIIFKQFRQCNNMDCKVRNCCVLAKEGSAADRIWKKESSLTAGQVRPLNPEPLNPGSIPTLSIRKKGAEGR